MIISVIIVPSTGIEDITDVVESTNSMLNILEPTTFQTTISTCFFIEAMIAVASSGKLVPKAITVKPINDSGTQNWDAIDCAEFTKK